MARVISDIVPCSAVMDDGETTPMCRAVVLIEPKVVLLYVQKAGAAPMLRIDYEEYGPPLAAGEPYWISFLNPSSGQMEKLRFFQKGGCACNSPLKRIPLARDIALIEQ